jgi:hypothetical protein
VQSLTIYLKTMKAPAPVKKGPLEDLHNILAELRKVIDPKGKGTYSSHQVWDKDRFLKSRQEAGAAEGLLVEQVTREDYLGNK